MNEAERQVVLPEVTDEKLLALEAQWWAMRDDPYYPSELIDLALIREIRRSRASESSPPQPECAMEGCDLVARYCVIHGAAATAPSAPPKCNFVNGYCTRCNANEIESEAIGECVAAPSAPTALTICPICDRGVDRICDVLAVQIGTEWYHKPCSRFAPTATPDLDSYETWRGLEEFHKNASGGESAEREQNKAGEGYDAPPLRNEPLAAPTATDWMRKAAFAICAKLPNRDNELGRVQAIEAIIAKYAGEHAGAVVLPAPTTQTGKEKR
jgi:hypothetical protein